MASFSSRVYALCSKVPKGRITTYGDLARALRSKAYRAVGNALNKNTHDFVTGDCTVPCHRVVGSDGCLGGFASGSRNKIQLLEKEGVHVRNGKVVDFEKVFVALKK
ncbi:MGMT family protein [Candidatus Micrarchaeota archaeon]|nr:MGMT family protein [Candidatus Micrarchaeota archaeon]